MQGNENIRRGFSLLVTLKSWLLQDCFPLLFSSKTSCGSPVLLKFESCNLYHYKKNCHKLAFSVLTEQLLYHIIFEWLHCYEVTLVKKCEESKTNVFHPKETGSKSKRRIIQVLWSWKWVKGCTISRCCFLRNATKKWFLNYWGWDNNTQGIHKHSKFWKNFTARWVNNKHVLIYGVLESTNDLRIVFVGHICFKKFLKSRKFIEIFHCCMARLRNKK